VKIRAIRGILWAADEREWDGSVMTAKARGGAVLGVLSAILTLYGCLSQAEREAARETGGDPRRGAEIIRRSGCGACHTIPGIDGAIGRLGPGLGGIALRARIADKVPNTPDNMIRWIQNPQKIDKFTSMPDVGVDERDARDISAYLYSLK
jgi:cytochrome c2